MTHINPNFGAFLGAKVNKAKANNAEKTETKSTPTASNADPKKLGGELDALAMLNNPINMKPSIERKEGFDMNAIMEKYGPLDVSTNQMLGVVANPEKGGKQAIDLFNLADQSFGASQGLDVANAAIGELFA